MTRTTLLALLLLGPASVAQDFDLVEVTATPGPQHPDVTFTFFPEGDTTAEAAGVSVGDLNGDGFEDLLFCGTAGRPNELYLNDGDGSFSEAAAALGIDEPAKRRGHALLIDHDNDGDLDVLTLGYPGGLFWQDFDLYTLFRNNGAPGWDFTDVTADAGFVLGPSAETTTVGVLGGAAAADVDADGWIDVLVTYWFSNFGPQFAMDQFRLWSNREQPAPGAGTPRQFVDTTQAAGLDGLGYWNWMPSLIDFDRDGFPDLHIAVEKGPDVLVLNQGDGTFGPDVADAAGMNFNDPALIPSGAWGNEMGAGLGDFDDDGDVDVYLTNSGANSGPHREDAFYRNDSDLSDGGGGVAFTHIGPDAEVTNNTYGAGWGAVFCDLDNDGDKDLIQTRGLINPSRNAAFLNLSPQTNAHGELAWQNVEIPLADYTGAGGGQDIARALATPDLDDDGDLDVVITRSHGDPYLPDDQRRAGVFLNTLVEDGLVDHGWLAVDLAELGGSLNTVGARLFVRTGGATGRVQMREVIVGSSFLAQESARMHFGLGDADEADWLVVRWFDGGLRVLTAASDSLSGRIAVSRAAAGPGARGDLDGDGDSDCDDLALFTLARGDPAAMDALVPDWPWRLTADADGNGLLDGRDFALLRPAVAQPICRIGGALAGTDGEPWLRGTGELVGGGQLDLVLGDALPDSDCWLIYGFEVHHATGFFGGMLVPDFFDVVGALGVDAQGRLQLELPWPAAVPAGIQLTVQAWIADAGAPAGYAASNALSILTP